MLLRKSGGRPQTAAEAEIEAIEIELTSPSLTETRRAYLETSLKRWLTLYPRPVVEVPADTTLRRNCRPD